MDGAELDLHDLTRRGVPLDGTVILPFAAIYTGQATVRGRHAGVLSAELDLLDLTRLGVSLDGTIVLVLPFIVAHVTQYSVHGLRAGQLVPSFS